MKRILALVMAGAASACAYSAPVDISPNLNVYSAYVDRLPGHYLLYVDTDALSTTVRPTGMNCSAHSFPLDAREVFRTSAVRTIEQLVESVQIVERPVPVSEVGHARGMIVVRAESLRARVQFIEGFWAVTGDARVDVTVSATADTQDGGRVFGTTASGDGAEQAPAGSACGGGAVAIGRSTEEAIREVLGQIGERLSNAPRMRAPPPAPES